MGVFGVAKRSRKSNLPNELLSIIHTGDPIAGMYREITGKSARIHVPLVDVIYLRTTATILRVLASKLDQLSRAKEHDHTILFSARQAIKMADYQIRSRKALGEFPEKD